MKKNKIIDVFQMQEIAALCCDLSDDEFEEIGKGDEDFDMILSENLGVDFEAFSAVVEAILNSGHLKINYSPLSKSVSLGLCRENISVGFSQDITNDFLQVMEHKFPINTAQIITVNGVNKYRVICLDMDCKFTVDGKDFF